VGRSLLFAAVGGGELRAGVTPVLRKGIDIRAAACGARAMSECE